MSKPSVHSRICFIFNSISFNFFSVSRNDLLIYLIDNWQYYKTDTNNLSYKKKILFLFISFSNSDIIYVAYLLEILLYVDDKQLYNSSVSVLPCY